MWLTLPICFLQQVQFCNSGSSTACTLCQSVGASQWGESNTSRTTDGDLLITSLPSVVLFANHWTRFPQVSASCVLLRPSLLSHKYEAHRECKPLPCLVWKVWQSLAKTAKKNLKNSLDPDGDSQYLHLLDSLQNKNFFSWTFDPQNTYPILLLEQIQSCWTSVYSWWRVSRNFSGHSNLYGRDFCWTKLIFAHFSLCPQPGT